MPKSIESKTRSTKQTPHERLSAEISRECDRQMSKSTKLADLIFWQRIRRLGTPAREVEWLQDDELNLNAFLSSYMHDRDFKQEAREGAAHITHALTYLQDKTSERHIQLFPSKDKRTYHLVARFPKNIAIRDSFTGRSIRTSQPTYVYLSPKTSCFQDAMSYVKEPTALPTKSLKDMEKLLRYANQSWYGNIMYSRYVAADEVGLPKQQYTFAYLLTGLVGYVHNEYMRLRLNDMQAFPQILAQSRSWRTKLSDLLHFR